MDKNFRDLYVVDPLLFIQRDSISRDESMEGSDQLLSIAKLLSKNEPVFVHGKQVAEFACAIAKKMQYCENGIKHIRLAAMFHGIGKLQLPAEVVNKPGALDKDELLLIRKHPEIGYRLLRDIKPELIIAEAALQHHERMDGSGYPFGLNARDISPVARIIAVADVIDVMIYPQVYRPALGIDEALREIRKNSGLLYDSEVVSVSSALIEDGEFCF
jgi:putative nucleotidyltransferase with HDIG domain